MEESDRLSEALVRVRCPCCGEVFALADALPVEDTEAQGAAVAEELEVQQAAVAEELGAQGAVAAEHAEIPGADQEEMIPVKLVFDGGSIGNPGRGYGSYQLTVRGRAERPKKLEFGDDYTNNEAEYDTLLAALEAVLRRASNPKRVRLDIRGDSQLIINQINGVWKAKDPRMQDRKQRVLDILAQVGQWSATWHDRSNSVKAFGH